MEEKYCEHCGNKVHIEAVVCPKCGKQLEELKAEENKQNPQVVINNTNTQSLSNVVMRPTKECDKWISFLLCFFLGAFGAHKFYEGKIGIGILYLLTLGFFGFGVIIDLIVILCKPNPYYV